MVDAERLGEIRRGVDQRASGFGIGRRGAAVDGERQRDQRMAEQPALDLGQRQHADDVAVALGDEVVGAMAEDVFDDPAPADAVEEGRLGAAVDECIPRGGVGRHERPDA